MINSGVPEPFDTRVGAYCVLVEDDKILLAHIRPAYFGKEYGWTLPGGGLEPFETPQACARRELYEETGLEAELTGLLAVRSFTVAAEDRIDENRRDAALISVQIMFTGRRTGGALRAEAEGSTDDVQWIALSDLPGLERVELVDSAVQALQATVQGQP